MEFSEARILVFAKAPVPGRVKTRLVVKYGQRGAAFLYKTMLRQTLGKLAAARLAPVTLYCAPDTRHIFFKRCQYQYHLELRRQQGTDLGRRMHHALSETLAHSPYAVLIGGDCVSLSSGDIHAALAALAAGKDAVLGPAQDGGYVLIGLRRPCRELFTGIAWGKSGVLAATRRRLQRAGLDWLELPPGWDVDKPADVRRWKQSYGNDSVV